MLKSVHTKKTKTETNYQKIKAPKLQAFKINLRGHEKDIVKKLLMNTEDGGEMGEG